MTFSVPEDLARRFLRQVPARQRSKYVTSALERSLKRRERELVRACRLSNEDPDVAAIEQEMAQLEDPIEEG